MASLTDLLLATLDPSKNQQAEAQIKQAEQDLAEKKKLKGARRKMRKSRSL